MIENFKSENIIVFFGKAGVGKSSTINTLFDFNFETNNVVACTKELNFKKYKNKFLVVDVPGISESTDADEVYFEEYKKAISNAGNIIWILQADSRVYRPDQVFIKRLKDYFHSETKITIGINQCDLIGPNNWNKKDNCPSSEQYQSLNERINDVQNKFSKHLGINNFEIITYSSKNKFNTDILLKRLLRG